MQGIEIKKFYNSTKQHRITNRIIFIQNKDEEKLENLDNITKEAIKYFQKKSSIIMVTRT